MSQALQAVTDEAFEDIVLNATKPVLVDFWADWCGPCKAIAPTLEALANDYIDKITVVKLDVSANQVTPAKYNVRGIPTLILFKEGRVAGTKVGGNATKADLATFLDDHL